VLRDEVRRGRVTYHSTSRRYRLNGALEPELRAALQAFAPPEPVDHSRPAGGRSRRRTESAGAIVAQWAAGASLGLGADRRERGAA
jgi:hypothetical protein